MVTNKYLLETRISTERICPPALPEEMHAIKLKGEWYLPVEAVVSHKKSEKICLIWDAAAAVNGIIFYKNI